MLIVNQVTGEFQAREEQMAKYLEKVKALLGQFRYHRVTQIPRAENAEADALARLASGNDLKGLVTFPIEKLDRPSIDREEVVLSAEDTPTWMDPIARYLTDSQLPENREEAGRNFSDYWQCPQ